MRAKGVMRTNGEREPTLIASVRRALHLLEAVAGHQEGVTAKRLARETGLPLGTTYHLLRTLSHEGYLHKLDDGGFVLGTALDTLREQGSAQSELVRVRPALAALRDELDMAVYFARYEEGDIRILDIADSPSSPRVHGPIELAQIGHASAIGKCVLRQLDEDRRQEYLSRYPPREITRHTITHRHELMRRLAAPSPSEVTWDEQEYELGTGCAAVPVIASGGATVGAIGISYGVHRRSHAEAAVQRLAATARWVGYALSI